MSFEDRKYIKSAEDMLVGIIVALGHDKKIQFKNYLEHMRMCPLQLRIKL